MSKPTRHRLFELMAKLVYVVVVFIFIGAVAFGFTPLLFIRELDFTAFRAALGGVVSH